MTTTWSAAAGTTTLYDGVGIVSETIFDGGETDWDVAGNVVLTRFDVTTDATTWTASAGTTTTWS